MNHHHILVHSSDRPVRSTLSTRTHTCLSRLLATVKPSRDIVRMRIRATKLGSFTEIVSISFHHRADIV
jgi:hypothetical protein